MEVTNNAQQASQSLSLHIKALAAWLEQLAENIDQERREFLLADRKLSKDAETQYLVQTAFVDLFGTSNPYMMTFNKDNATFAKMFEETMLRKLEQENANLDPNEERYYISKIPGGKEDETVFVMNEKTFELAKQIQKESFIKEQGYYAEVSAESFCKANIDRPLIQLTGLTENEIIAFRQKNWLSEDCITYTSVKDDDGRYSILFNRNEMLFESHDAAGHSFLVKNQEDPEKTETVVLKALDEEKECMFAEMMKIIAYANGNNSEQNMKSCKLDIQMEYEALNFVPGNTKELHFVSAMGSNIALHIDANGFSLNTYTERSGQTIKTTIMSEKKGSEKYETKLLQAIGRIKHPAMVDKDDVENLCRTQKGVTRTTLEGEKVSITSTMIKNDTFRAELIDLLAKETFLSYCKEQLKKNIDLQQNPEQITLEDMRNCVKDFQSAVQTLEKHKLFRFSSSILKNDIVPLKREELDCNEINDILSNEGKEKFMQLTQKYEDMQLQFTIGEEFDEYAKLFEEKINQEILMDEVGTQLIMNEINSDAEKQEYESRLKSYENRDTREIVDIIQVSKDDVSRHYGMQNVNRNSNEEPDIIEM